SRASAQKLRTAEPALSRAAGWRSVPQIRDIVRSEPRGDGRWLSDRRPSPGRHGAQLLSTRWPTQEYPALSNPPERKRAENPPLHVRSRIIVQHEMRSQRGCGVLIIGTIHDRTRHARHRPPRTLLLPHRSMEGFRWLE